MIEAFELIKRSDITNKATLKALTTVIGNVRSAHEREVRAYNMGIDQLKNRVVHRVVTSSDESSNDSDIHKGSDVKKEHRGSDGEDSGGGGGDGRAGRGAGAGTMC